MPALFDSPRLGAEKKTPSKTAAAQPPMQALFRTPEPESQRGMLRDIWETPKIIEKLLKAHVQSDHKISLPSLEKSFPEPHKLSPRTPLELMSACSVGASGNYSNKFIIVGCGTSYHAALLAEYLIETIARIPVEVQYASEYRHRTPILTDGDVVVTISSSGETFDVVECQKLIRQHKANVLLLGVTNGVSEDELSTVARESDAHIHVGAGQEIGVASTKAFSATALVFVLLSIALGDMTGTLSKEDKEILMEKLKDLPEQMQNVLDRESKPVHEECISKLNIGECLLWDISCQNVLAQNFIFLGRGFNFPIALEGAMKCKEIAYIHAEGYPAAEMKHGPIALIDQFMPVVFIAPRSDPTFDKIKANISEVKTRNGSIIAITDDESNELEDDCEYVIRVPPTHEYLMPLLAVIPLQLLAYMMGALRGNQVDAPRSLTKIVGDELPVGEGKHPGGYNVL